MASLSHTLKFVLNNTASQTVKATCSRTLAVSSVSNKPSNGNGKKASGSSSLKSIPQNVEEIKNSQKVKFSPHRARDSTSARLQTKPSSGNFGKEFMGSQGVNGTSSSSHNGKLNVKSRPTDSHMDVYDVSTSVSLSSVMQSTVPQPYNINGKKAPAHLNMPGGGWAQGDKYVSGDQQDHHSRNIPRNYQGTAVHQSLMLFGSHPVSAVFLRPLLSHDHCGTNSIPRRWLHWNCDRRAKTPSLDAPNKPFLTSLSFVPPSLLGDGTVRFLATHEERGKGNRNSPPGDEEPKLTQRQRLKKAAKEYGATVVVFHVAISLVSLGSFYLLVSSGVDMSGLVDKLGINLASLEEEEEAKRKESSISSTAPIDEAESSPQPPTSSLPSSDGADRHKAVAMAAGVSTFVLAYAIHKVFAPVRIAITLTATPFIVRHLRKIGFLKAAPPKVSS